MSESESPSEQEDDWHPGISESVSDSDSGISDLTGTALLADAAAAAAACAAAAGAAEACAAAAGAKAAGAAAADASMVLWYALRVTQ